MSAKQEDELQALEEDITTHRTYERKDTQDEAAGVFEPTFARLVPRPVSPFWIDALAMVFLGCFSGLFGLGYVYAIDYGEQAWYQIDNPGFPDDNYPALSYCQGKVWWIGVGAITGFITGAIKYYIDMEDFPSFLVHLRERATDYRMSVQICVLSILGQIGGASLGPEAGLGAMGSAWGQLLADICQRFSWGRDVDRKLYTISGVVAAFAAIIPTAYIPLVLVIELGVPLGPENWGGRSGIHVIILWGITSIASSSVFYAIDGGSYMDVETIAGLGSLTQQITAYDFSIGILFGFGGAALGVIYLLLAGVTKVVIQPIKTLVERKTNKRIRIFFMCTLGGVMFGALMYVFPMTVGSGSLFISPVASSNSSQLDNGLLISSAFAKLVAFWICNTTGLVGGLVFPMIISSLMLARVIINWTGINSVLGLSCGFVALTTAIVPSPFAFVLLSYISLTLGQQGLTPILATALTSYLCFVGVGIPQAFLAVKAKNEAKEKKLEEESEETTATV